MNPSEVITIILVGTLAGMLAMLGGMAAILGVYVKVPGGKSARYWASGSALILLGMTLFIVRGASAGFLSGMVIFALFLSGHVLQWRGLQIFYYKNPAIGEWQIAAAYFLAYCLLLLNGASFQLRMAYFSLVPIVVWPLCMREVIVTYRRVRRTATVMAVSGLLILLVGAFAELVVGVVPGMWETIQKNAIVLMVIETVVPIFGSLLYVSSLILLYFERAGEQANFTATHDELTSLLNRRAIIAAGEREIELARRSAQSLAVAFVDIDFFKKVNDVHGHKAGDMVLKEVAKILANTCRNVDFVGRYGGEEFCMVFPGDHRGDVEMLGERLVTAVRSHCFIDMPSVTISVGLAVLPIGDKNETWYSLIEKADLELYKAKQNGRDQYSIMGKAQEKPKLVPASPISTVGSMTPNAPLSS